MNNSATGAPSEPCPHLDTDMTFKDLSDLDHAGDVDGTLTGEPTVVHTQPLDSAPLSLPQRVRGSLDSLGSVPDGSMLPNSVAVSAPVPAASTGLDTAPESSAVGTLADSLPAIVL